MTTLWPNHALQRTRQGDLRSLFFFISFVLSAIQRRCPAGSLSLDR